MKGSKKKSISVTTFLWPFVKERWPIYLGLFICVILINSFGALYPFFFKQLVNQISHFQSSNMKELWYSGIAIVTVWGLSELLSNLQDFIVIYSFPQFKVSIRQYLLENAINKPLNFFSGELTGAIAERLSSIPNNSLNLLSIFIFNFFSTFITLLSSFLLMISVSTKYIAILVIWAVVHLTIASSFKNHLNQLCENHAKTRANLSGTIYDILINLFNIHAFCGWRHEGKYFKKVQHIDMRQEQGTMHGFLHMKLLQSLAIVTLFAAIIYSLLHDWEVQQINLGEITLIMMLTANIINCIRGISSNVNAFIIDKSNVSESLHFLNLVDVTHTPFLSHAETTQPSKPDDSIIFNNIYFSYQKHDPSRWVIEDLSLEIKPGEHIGLVGLSGAGKTTLLKLLLGFYQPNKGEILVGGQSIHNTSIETLRDRISYVAQDPLLFHRTIAENIRYSKPSASAEDILQAVESANCKSFIEQTPQKLESMVNDSGGNFSRGQLQRIVLARGILRDAPIVLLDEPTASVDLINEKFIQDSIDKLIKGKTAIIVAHRLETLSNVNRILVLDKGKIVEQGSFTELLKQGGLFATMWESRKQTFEHE